MPCPNEVNIPWAMNALLSKSYGDRYFNNAAEAIETVKNCVRCGQCESKCPYELPIMDTIASNVDKFNEIDLFNSYSTDASNEEDVSDEGD